MILTPKDFLSDQIMMSETNSKNSNAPKTARKVTKINKQKTCIAISKELFDKEETKSFLNSKFCEGMLISIVGCKVLFGTIIYLSFV